MAHKKGVGSSKNGRESESKRLGVKIFGGQFAKAGNIIVRQRGTKHNPDNNVGMGKDHTLFALIDGTVTFRKKRNGRSYVSVLPTSVRDVEGKTTPPETFDSKQDLAESLSNDLAGKEEVVENVSENITTKIADNVKDVVEDVTSVVEDVASTVEDAAKNVVENISDDLTKIEGIGPKSAEALLKAGVEKFSDLADKTSEEIAKILSEASSRLASLNPETWPKQAQLAAEGKWDELKKWQDELDGGKA